MFDVIREMGILSKSDCQFYVATMILSLEYLHKRGLIYRDLKPENIMIDQNGILYIIDLGTAKNLKDTK